VTKGIEPGSRDGYGAYMEVVLGLRIYGKVIR